MLIQAIMSISDMFMLSTNRVTSVFVEDVEKYLNDNDVRYISNATFNGASGFTHNFEFVISKSRKAGKRFVKVINNSKNDQSKITIFLWNDVKQLRDSESKLFVFLNNKDKAIKNEALTAFSSYGIKTITWKERENSIQLLTA